MMPRTCRGRSLRTTPEVGDLSGWVPILLGMSAKQTSPWTPSDFEAVGVPHLGEFASTGTIDLACERALRLLDSISETFSTHAIQFSFNGTPALAVRGNTVADVVTDWNKRWFDYQLAAGIL